MQCGASAIPVSKVPVGMVRTVCLITLLVGSGSLSSGSSSSSKGLVLPIPVRAAPVILDLRLGGSTLTCPRQAQA